MQRDLDAVAYDNESRIRNVEVRVDPERRGEEGAIARCCR